MRKKGFTLIELLAVIVILALIALITIPAVLRITENAKVSSYRRSIDLYGKAVSTAINAYKADMVEKHESYQVTFENIQSYIDYEGHDIDCKVSKIYSDDTILLTECTVDGNLVTGEKGKGYGGENYYYYYTNAKKRVRILEYADAVNKALQGKENIGNECTIQNNGNVICNNQQIEVKSNLEKPISGTLSIKNNEVIGYTNLQFEDKKTETEEEIPQVIDEQEINTTPSNNNQNSNNSNNSNQNNNENNNNNNNSNNNVNNQEDTTEPSYIGYYADVDGNGTVDGVIYADLAFSKSGKYGKGIIYSYSYEAKSNLKEYLVSSQKYNGDFGEKEIVTVKENSTGNQRFYVMALEDFKASYRKTFTWYQNSSGKTKFRNTSGKFGKGYTNTGIMINIWNKNGVGEGSYEGATQTDSDIWKYIQTKYNDEKWYIPSLGEWIAFADYLVHKENNPLSIDNYNTIYKLSKCYWPSDEVNENVIDGISFELGKVGDYNLYTQTCSVRLGITF